MSPGRLGKEKDEMLKKWLAVPNGAKALTADDFRGLLNRAFDKVPSRKGNSLQVLFG